MKAAVSGVAVVLSHLVLAPPLAPPPRRDPMRAAVVAAATAAGVAVVLSFLVLVPPLLTLTSANSAAGTAAAALLVPTLVVGRPWMPWAAPPAEPQRAASLSAAAEMLLAAVGVSAMNLLPGGGLVPTSGAVAAKAKTLLPLYACSLFIALTAGLFLRLLSAARPIPETVSHATIRALKLLAVMLAAVNLLFAFASVPFS